VSLITLCLFCALRSLRVGIHTGRYLVTICALLLQFIFRPLPAQVSCSDFIAVLPLRYAVSVSCYRLQDLNALRRPKFYWNLTPGIPEIVSPPLSGNNMV